jgi:GMP synthase-like glutamine amidotransferase
MRIHYLQHVPFEGSGYFQSWAEEQGHELTGTRLFKAEELPAPETIEGLVIMGGPMGVHDEQKYSWMKKEKLFIKACIEQKKKVLGICLGAQLIADVLGAKVVPMKEKEIGWFPVEWTRDAHSHPMLDFLPDRQVVLHWHGDMFHLPDRAIQLAASKGCENQGFLVDEHVLGPQFHLEMTRDGLAELIKNSNEELANIDGSFVREPAVMNHTSYFTENHQTLHLLLNQFFMN